MSSPVTILPPIAGGGPGLAVEHSDLYCQATPLRSTMPDQIDASVTITLLFLILIIVMAYLRHIDQ